MRRMSPGPTGHFSAANLLGLALTAGAALAIGSPTGWIAAMGLPPVSQAMTLPTLAALVALAATVAVAPLPPGLSDRQLGRWSGPFRPLDANECLGLARESGPDWIGGQAVFTAGPDHARGLRSKSVREEATPHPGRRRTSYGPWSASTPKARHAFQPLVQRSSGRPSRLHVRGPDGLEPDRCRERSR